MIKIILLTAIIMYGWILAFILGIFPINNLTALGFIFSPAFALAILDTNSAGKEVGKRETVTFSTIKEAPLFTSETEFEKKVKNK